MDHKKTADQCDPPFDMQSLENVRKRLNWKSKDRVLNPFYTKNEISLNSETYSGVNTHNFSRFNSYPKKKSLFSRSNHPAILTQETQSTWNNIHNYTDLPSTDFQNELKNVTVSQESDLKQTTNRFHFDKENLPQFDSCAPKIKKMSCLVAEFFKYFGL